MSNQSARKSALIVDYRLEELAALREILLQLGFQTVEVASSVNMAMSALREQSFDVVLACYDLGKDEKNGLQVLQESHAERLRLFGTLFMLVVDAREADILVGSLETAPNAYISKPFSRSKIAAILDKLLRVKKATARLDQAMDEGRWEEAVSHCHNLIAAYPALKVYLERLLGVCLLESGQYREACDLFAALSAVRKVVWAQVGFGIALYRLGDHAAATEVLQGVIDQQHISVEAFSWLARSLWMGGDAGQAVSLMRKAVMLQPTVPQLHSELGNLAAWNSDWVISVEAFRRAVEYGRHSIYQNPDDSCAFVASTLAANEGKPLSDVLELEVIRTMESTVRDFDEAVEVQFRSHLVLADFREQAGNSALVASELQLAVDTFERMTIEAQWFWIEPLLDRVSGTEHEPKMLNYRKFLARKAQEVSWAKYHNDGRAAYSEGKYDVALNNMVSAAKQPEASVRARLDAVQLLIDRGKHDSAIFSEPDSVECLHQMAKTSFALCSDKQRERYQKLYQAYSGARHVADNTE